MLLSIDSTILLLGLKLAGHATLRRDSVVGGLEAKEAVRFDKVFPIQGSNGGVTLREEEEALEGRGGADCPAIGRGLKTGTGAWSPGRHPGLEPGH